VTAERTSSSSSGKDRYEDRYEDREDRSRGRYLFTGGDRDTQKKTVAFQNSVPLRRPTMLGGSRYQQTRRDYDEEDDERDSSGSPIDVVGDSPPNGKRNYDDLDDVDDISGDEREMSESKRLRLSEAANSNSNSGASSSSQYPSRSGFHGSSHRPSLLLKTEPLSSPLSPGDESPRHGYDRPHHHNRSRLLQQVMSGTESSHLEELEPLEDKFDGIPFVASFPYRNLLMF